MEYKIVPLTEEHVSGIKLIDDLCFESPWSLKSFKSELSNPLAVYFVALMGEQVIGYCGYWWVFSRKSFNQHLILFLTILQVNHLYINPKHYSSY